MARPCNVCNHYYRKEIEMRLLNKDKVGETFAGIARSYEHLNETGIKNHYYKHMRETSEASNRADNIDLENILTTAEKQSWETYFAAQKAGDSKLAQSALSNALRCYELRKREEEERRKLEDKDKVTVIKLKWGKEHKSSYDPFQNDGIPDETKDEEELADEHYDNPPDLYDKGAADSDPGFSAVLPSSDPGLHGGQGSTLTPADIVTTNPKEVVHPNLDNPNCDQSNLSNFYVAEDGTTYQRYGSNIHKEGELDTTLDTRITPNSFLAQLEGYEVPAIPSNEELRKRVKGQMW